ncbi:MAG: 7-cyano-7-deazaguanine synthase QueC [Alistipes senegalensis]|nr:7-cyano-7-deazaguanine synthase QueC [Oxalobacter formigenes]MCM1280527.1 7-cyano-7-deazaguanine synthase QueC [Alistipes senegalensis]
MLSSNHALVLFSGGQDSTTCLAWALSRYDHVETIGFDYGQRHHVELALRPAILTRLQSLSPEWEKRLGMDHLIDLSLISRLSETALTSETEIRLLENGLPNTFVPGRNLFFMMTAATLAYRRNMGTLVGGMCETDFSGYPDCRDDTMKALQLCLNLGMDARFRLEMPLMWKDKAQTWELAQTLGGAPLVEIIRLETHTCYLGERCQLREWGYGCGQCPACKLRARGYARFISGKAAA